MFEESLKENVPVNPVIGLDYILMPLASVMQLPGASAKAFEVVAKITNMSSSKLECLADYVNELEH